MKQKQGEATLECDAIQDSLYGIRLVIEKISRNEDDENATGDVNSSLEAYLIITS